MDFIEKIQMVILMYQLEQQDYLTTMKKTFARLIKSYKTLKLDVMDMKILLAL